MSYMDVWQMFVLPSILHKAVFSVYPRHGDLNVCSDLHGCTEPKNNITCKPGELTFSLSEIDLFVVIWAWTRNNMNLRHWVPNPVVPALAYIHSEAVCMQAPTEKMPPTKRCKSEKKVIHVWKNISS